jgi:hypothetical protein
MPPTVSRATASGSSVVPGLAKHTSIPESLAALIIYWAPFIITSFEMI